MALDPFFGAAGALRDDYERVDWAATPLGPVESWQPSLRSALSLALATRFPITLLWGRHLVLLYNEAYVALIEDKHPTALGSPAHTVFPEVWDGIGPLLTGVLDGAGPTWVENSRLLLRRRGFLEECFFTFSYSPATGEDGTVAGVVDIATETTRQVVDRRRLELLTDLDGALRDLPSPALLAERALPVLRSATADLPAVDLVDAGGSPTVPGFPGGAPASLEEGSLVLQQTSAGRVAWLGPFSTLAPGRRPLLAVRLSEHLAPDEPYLEFLRLVAAALRSALSVAVAREAEHAAAVEARSLSEALQRNLLTDPPQPDELEIAARYVPAARLAQVGGDWYDAFTTSGGATCLVVGDVAGHDQRAAVAMAQLRNLLRGIGYTLSAPPSVVLRQLDRAMLDLHVGVLATAVLAVVEQTDDDAAAGLRRLRWSNAGHPPAVLVEPDGAARLLHGPPDLLLGLDPGTDRVDHSVVLAPGATVLMVTDGLVERRRADLDDGLAWLVEAAAEHAGLPLEALCDALLDAVDGHLDDDVALLALRAHPMAG